MRKSSRFLSVVALGVLACGLTGPAARAGVLIEFLESGGDVVATGSGTLNLSALTSAGTSGYVPAVQASLGAATLGLAANGTDFSGISGPANFGGGNFTAATSGSGDILGVIAVANRVTVPQGYTSGNSLSGTATWTGKTFATLGLTAGTYVWSWGTGGTADSLTVRVGPAPPPAVPEPATLASLSLVGAAVLVRRVIRRR